MGEAGSLLSLVPCDASSPHAPRPSQKLYTVCDVAMNIIMSKSTTYSLESPKDPVLPARFFTQPDKVAREVRAQCGMGAGRVEPAGPVRGVRTPGEACGRPRRAPCRD